MDKNKSPEVEQCFSLSQAIEEANRCLLCHDAPCSKNCPAGTEPATFIRKLRLRNITGAIRTIKTNNILGGACGVLCPSARLCEKECVAKGLEKPIQIKKIQRSIVEHSWKIGFSCLEKGKPNGKKVAVIGAGPSGIACASELAKNGFSVTVFEEKSGPGGVLAFGVPDHRYSKTLLERELKDIESLGVEFKFNTPISSDNPVKEILDKGYDAVFIGIGLWSPVKLKENHMNVEGVLSAIDFLEEFKTKNSFDGFKGKKVAVIGGGSVAIDCAESAVKAGAKDVYLIYRRSYLQMPAERDELISALNSGVQFLLLNQPLDYIEKDGKLTGMELARTELQDADISGRRRPVEVPNSRWFFSIDFVIEAIGAKAPGESPDWYPDVDVSAKKFIVTDEKSGRTSLKNVFAGGDIVRGPALIVDAIADGKLAAQKISDYLNDRRDQC